MRPLAARMTPTRQRQFRSSSTPRAATLSSPTNRRLPQPLPHLHLRSCAKATGPARAVATPTLPSGAQSSAERANPKPSRNAQCVQQLRAWCLHCKRCVLSCRGKCNRCGTAKPGGGGGGGGGRGRGTDGGRGRGRVTAAPQGPPGLNAIPPLPAAIDSGVTSMEQQPSAGGCHLALSFGALNLRPSFLRIMCWTESICGLEESFSLRRHVQ